MSLLGRCLPCVSRLSQPRPPIILRHNSSSGPNKDEGGEASNRPGHIEHPAPFYNLPDPVFDNTDEYYLEPSKRAPVRPGSLVRDSNWMPMFFDLNDVHNSEDGDGAGHEPVDAETAEEDMSPLHHLPIAFNRLGSLHRYPLLTRRVVQQTGKGKIQSMYTMLLVGNGDGLVGLGEGKAESVPQASEKAFAQAVRNMDYVDRFEGRTLWTELDTKLGATRLLMRPRPVGFGLACAPGVHQVLKAAGIKDASAKVWGSRNKLNVVKAAIRVLHAGHAPLAMGNGIGGRGRRLEAGSGMRGKAAVERERGRRIIDGTTW